MVVKTWALKKKGKLVFIQDCDLRRPWKQSRKPLRHDYGKPVNVVLKV